MGFLENLIEQRATLANPDKFLQSFFAGQEGYTGKTVSSDNALAQSAVFGCVRIVSEAAASTPIHLYKRLDRGKERATDLDLYWLLKDEPNPQMSAYTFKEVIQSHIEMWGNGFAEIERDEANRPIALWPLRPDKMEVRREGGVIYYIYQLDNKKVRLRADQVFHIPGMGFDGLIGYNPITYNMQAIGLALGIEEFGARFYGNGAHPGLAIRHPGVLSQKAQENVRASFEDAHRGLEKAHRIGILEEGMEIEQIGIPPDAAQFLETRKFQIAEIARFFRMQLHKLQEMDQATFSNIEHQAIEHVQDTLQPRFTRWESEIQRSLLHESQKRTHYAEFLIDNLLRGDITARYEAHAIGIQNAILSPNDVRDMENKNPYEGGDVYLAPLNMIPVDMIGELPESTEPTPVDDEDEEDERSLKIEDRAVTSRRRVADSFRSVFEQTAERIIRAEIREVSKAIKREDRSVDSFITWLEAYYAGNSAYIISQIKPLIRSYGEAITAEVAREMGATAHMDSAFADSYADSYAKRHNSHSLNQLKDVIKNNPEMTFDAVRERLDEWREKRTGKVVGVEMVKAEAAFAKNSYSDLGVTKLKWRTFGKNCPYCNSLEGKVVGIEENFVSQGDTLHPDDADRPMTVGRNIGHPPVHAGCDCTVEPEL